MALFAAAMLWSASAARANGIIDPRMMVVQDEFSDAIFQGAQFYPNVSGGGVFGFFNGTAQSITELTFETLILPDISPVDIAAAFVCNQGNNNPFFINCRIDYAATSGRLTIAFWGTSAAPAIDHPGVTPLPAGCTALTADTPGCTSVGHFAVSLNNTFDLNETTGGWLNVPGYTPLFRPGTPVFTATEIQYTYGATPVLIATDPVVPEPRVTGLFGSGMAVLFWLKRRRTSRASKPDPENQS